MKFIINDNGFESGAWRAFRVYQRKIYSEKRNFGGNLISLMAKSLTKLNFQICRIKFLPKFLPVCRVY